jgi:hypothetical protein
MNTFKNVVLAEFYRFSKQPFFLLLCCIPLIIPFGGIFSKIDIHPETLVRNMGYAHEGNLVEYLSILPTMIFSVLAPFIMTTVGVYVIYTDKQSNSIKYAFLEPYSFKIYLLSKSIFIIFTTLLSLLFIFISHVLFLYIFSILRSEVVLEWNINSLIYIFIRYFALWVKSLGVVSIVILIGFLSKHFIPISFSVSIFGILVVPFNYQPYTLSYYFFSKINLLHQAFILKKSVSIDFNVFKYLFIEDVLLYIYVLLPLLLIIVLQKRIKRNL